VEGARDAELGLDSHDPPLHEPSLCLRRTTPG